MRLTANKLTAAPLTARKLIALKLGEAAAAGFDPVSLSPVAFFDKSNANYLRQLSAGTGTVSLGDPVGYVEDLSGNGNHATQSTSTARPVYARQPVGGRRNLLSSTATLATQSKTVTAVEHTLSFTGTGTVTLSGASTAGPLVGTGAGDRVTLSFTPSAASLTLTVSGSVTDAQLEIGSSATAYQDVVTSGGYDYDITESGKGSVYGLLYDGVDDYLVTPSIDLSGTDKATLAVGGVTSATTGSHRILSVNTSTPGRFEFIGEVVNDRITTYVGGTTGIVKSNSGTPISSPFTTVARSDISAPLFSVNGSGSSTTSTDSQGTGNFTDAPLAIAATAAGIGEFTGHIFSAFLIGRYITDEETDELESWLSSKAGVE